MGDERNKMRKERWCCQDVEAIHRERFFFQPSCQTSRGFYPIPCRLTENVERGNWGWVDLVWSPAAPVTLDVLLRTRQLIVLKRICQNEIQILFHEKKKDILKGRAMVRENLLLPCMKTLFLSLAYPQSVLVICQLVGHWGNLVLHVGVFLEVLFTGHMCFPPGAMKSVLGSWCQCIQTFAKGRQVHPVHTDMGPCGYRLCVIHGNVQSKYFSFLNLGKHRG